MNPHDKHNHPLATGDIVRLYHGGEEFVAPVADLIAAEVGDLIHVVATITVKVPAAAVAFVGKAKSPSRVSKERSTT